MFSYISVLNFIIFQRQTIINTTKRTHTHVLVIGE